MTEPVTVDRVRPATPSAPRHVRHRAGILTVLRHPGALWRFLTDRGAPIWPRVVAVLTLAYVVLPIDAIPDVIPVLGWLDDLGVVTFALGLVASRAARYVDPPALPDGSDAERDRA
jgi:uncharacterized membrane protein YkvA (DUF1232 family)